MCSTGGINVYIHLETCIYLFTLFLIIYLYHSYLLILFLYLHGFWFIYLKWQLESASRWNADKLWPCRRPGAGRDQHLSIPCLASLGQQLSLGPGQSPGVSPGRVLAHGGGFAGPVMSRSLWRWFCLCSWCVAKISGHQKTKWFHISVYSQKLNIMCLL